MRAVQFTLHTVHWPVPAMLHESLQTILITVTYCNHINSKTAWKTDKKSEKFTKTEGETAKTKWESAKNNGMEL